MLFLKLSKRFFVRLEKARDLSKLTKKVIIDKNGNRKTVYVKTMEIFSDNIKKQISKYIESIRKDKVENGVCLDVNGKVLVHRIGDEKGINHSSRELIKMNGSKLYIHNHPNGSDFSDDDLLFIMTNKINTIVAVGVRDNKKVNYELKLKKEIPASKIIPIFIWYKNLIKFSSNDSKVMDEFLKTYGEYFEYKRTR